MSDKISLFVLRLFQIKFFDFFFLRRLVFLLTSLGLRSSKMFEETSFIDFESKLRISILFILGYSGAVCIHPFWAVSMVLLIEMPFGKKPFFFKMDSGWVASLGWLLSFSSVISAIERSRSFFFCRLRFFLVVLDFMVFKKEFFFSWFRLKEGIGLWRVDLVFLLLQLRAALLLFFAFAGLGDRRGSRFFREDFERGGLLLPFLSRALCFFFKFSKWSSSLFLKSSALSSNSCSNSSKKWLSLKFFRGSHVESLSAKPLHFIK